MKMSYDLYISKLDNDTLRVSVPTGSISAYYYLATLEVKEIVEEVEERVFDTLINSKDFLENLEAEGFSYKIL